jgi:predicted MFS family arabinose efflux permease
VFIPLTAWLMALWGWRHAFIALAALHLLVCAPLHALTLRGAPRPVPRVATADPQALKGVTDFIFSPPFLLIGVFVVLLMAVTVALPAHMVSLLRENGLREVWVIAIPAGIGVIQVLGRLLLYFF